MLGLSMTRRRARGAAGYQPPAGNVITNWAGTGTGGTGGLPDGWSASSLAGVTFSVLSTMPYRGGNTIEFQFTGTATASGTLELRIAPLAAAPAAAGQVWRARIFAEAVVAALPSDMTVRTYWRDAANVFLAWGNLAPISGTLTGPEIGPTDSSAPASTGFVGMVVRLPVTTGQAINLRYRIFAPTLVRIS